MKKSRSRQVLKLDVGSDLRVDGTDYHVVQLLSGNKVVVRNKANGLQEVMTLGRLAETDESVDSEAPPPDNDRDLQDLSDYDWQRIDHWKKALDPMLRQKPTKEQYTQIAAELQVSVATLYRYLAEYKRTGRVSSLLRRKRPGGGGQSRLDKRVETIIAKYITEKFLTTQKPTITHAHNEIRRLAYAEGLQPPSRNTVIARVKQIEQHARVEARLGKGEGRRYNPNRGSIPDAEWPLAVAQMDHTQLPIMIVDDDYRQPIKRPWVTFIIDVYTRMVLGMYLTLEKPSSLSAGMCISHALLLKDQWLEKLGLSKWIDSWPSYGKMDVIHVDNAAEFRGQILSKSCKEYQIDVNLRPVGQPAYGAHIERLMGTFSEALKPVPGATFSGPKEKGEYDAEGNASLTFDELERWLALEVVKYHGRLHRGINTTPLKKWEEGILGTTQTRGRGLPSVYKDRRTVRIDFLPFDERCIRPDGVTINGVRYYSDDLKPWINQKQADNTRRGVRHRVRFDPRDISVVYFFEPTLRRYLEIPYRDNALPSISAWELKAAQAKARAEGAQSFDERHVFALATEQRDIEMKAAAKKKSARHEQQRRSQHAKARESVQRSVTSQVTQEALTETTDSYEDVRGIDEDY